MSASDQQRERADSMSLALRSTDNFWHTVDDTEVEFTSKLEDLTDPSELWIMKASQTNSRP
jgi:hypothetical protein